MKVKVKVVRKPSNTRICSICGRRTYKLPHTAMLIQREIVMISAGRAAA